eukprot:GFKZ01005254.1.p2 GENE.GFKZ01005254.1~~GFKZ01005254.1.p2  ORF type:complete len:270 (-),score=27.54 GFKZ01005254.1:2154-2963(-)
MTHNQPSPQKSSVSLSKPKSKPIRRHRRSSNKSIPIPTPQTKDPLHLLALVVATHRPQQTTSPPSKLVCPLCASTFGRRCELKRHISEVHTPQGPRRFTCKHPTCTKSFTRKDALAKHDIVKHQGKRRFVCPVCSEKFTSRYDLGRHKIRVHSNVKKRFTCEYCAAGFSQKSQLTMHKGRVHATAKAHSHVSIDSLAAVAVAIAKQEEEKSQTLHPSFFQSGPPTHQREADATSSASANLTSSKEIDPAAATFGAHTILKAAAVLCPDN